MQGASATSPGSGTRANHPTRSVANKLVEYIWTQCAPVAVAEYQHWPTQENHCLGLVSAVAAGADTQLCVSCKVHVGGQSLVSAPARGENERGIKDIQCTTTSHTDCGATDACKFILTGEATVGPNQDKHDITRNTSQHVRYTPTCKNLHVPAGKVVSTHSKVGFASCRVPVSDNDAEDYITHETDWCLRLAYNQNKNNVTCATDSYTKHTRGLTESRDVLEYDDTNALGVLSASMPSADVRVQDTSCSFCRNSTRALAYLQETLPVRSPKGCDLLYAHQIVIGPYNV